MSICTLVKIKTYRDLAITRLLGTKHTDLVLIDLCGEFERKRWKLEIDFMHAYTESKLYTKPNS